MNRPIRLVVLGALAFTALGMSSWADTQDYADTLHRFVDGHGMVNYAGLKANHQSLDRFLKGIADQSPDEYKTWPKNKQIAFWINAYNAITLKSIINNYPISASFFGSFLYPKNSIRQISGVWDKTKWDVMGRQMTLNNIEHDTLRKDFHEPRIHVALVCASISCPPLRNVPYEGDKLDDQLNDQLHRYFTNGKGLRIDRANNVVYFSEIFKWYGKDLVGAPVTGFDDHSDVEKAVLSVMAKHVDEADAKYLRDGSYRIKYMDYNWGLNEQGTKTK